MVSGPIHAFLEFFLVELHAIFFSSQLLLSHITIIKTMPSGERGMNPVEMTIVDSRKKILAMMETMTYFSSVLYATNRPAMARIQVVQK